MTRQITIVALFEDEANEQANLLITEIQKLLATANQGIYVLIFSFIVYVCLCLCIVFVCVLKFGFF